MYKKEAVSHFNFGHGEFIIALISKNQNSK